MSFVAFVKRHPIMAAGLGIPCAALLAFALIKQIGLFPGPQHDVLFFYTHRAKGESNFRLQVVDGKMLVTAPGKGCHFGIPKLYRYSPRTNALTLITIPLVSTAKRCFDEPPHVPITVPELQGLNVSDSKLSPDGYEFVPVQYDWGTKTFGPSRKPNMMKKGNDDHSIPDAPVWDGVHKSQSPTFVAWILLEH